MDKRWLPHLDEVGVEASQQDGLDQLVLVTLLVVEGCRPLALAGPRHQLGLVQVLTELVDGSREGRRKGYCPSVWRGEAAPGTIVFFTRGANLFFAGLDIRLSTSF